MASPAGAINTGNESRIRTVGLRSRSGTGGGGGSGGGAVVAKHEAEFALADGWEHVSVADPGLDSISGREEAGAGLVGSEIPEEVASALF